MSGTLVEWETGQTGVRHLAGQCESAFPSLSPSELIRSTDPVERWTTVEWLGRTLEAQAWTFAKTMPDLPHDWSLRPSYAASRGKVSSWASEADFNAAVLGLRQYGRPRRYQGQGKFSGRKVSTNYVKMDVNEHYYWGCAPQLSALEMDALINRALRANGQPPAAPYVIDPGEPVDWEDAARVSIVGRSVLDVGGTYAVAAEDAASYLAIGAPGDLHRVPSGLSKIDTLLPWFVPRDPRRFDVVLALYGVIAALSPVEVQRLPLLAAPGGVVVAMFEWDADVDADVQWSDYYQAGPWLVTVMRLA